MNNPPYQSKPNVGVDVEYLTPQAQQQIDLVRVDIAIGQSERIEAAAKDPFLDGKEQQRIDLAKLDTQRVELTTLINGDN
jgi:hypothetical protein